MDPVSHVVMGRAVVAALDQRHGSRFGPGVGAAAIVGALVPDIDCVLMPVGWDIYLRFHQAGTHSLLGACVLGCGVGAILSALVRESRFSGLTLSASVAAWSHLTLDVLSGAPLGLAWPITPARVALPLVAMADPWFVALFAAGTLVMWRLRTELQRAALGVLLASAILFGVKGLLYGRALHAMGADPRLDSRARRAIQARFGSWTEWNVFERDHDALRVWRASAISAPFVPLLTWPIVEESPLVVASRSLETVRNFLSVHDLAFAIVRPQDAGRTEVVWSDVRYCWQDIPGAAGIQCALWFGGEFDENGRAVMQVVHLGEWTQTRPPSP